MEKIKSFLKKIDEICNLVYEVSLNFIRKHLFVIALLIIFILSLFIRLAFLDFQSRDMMVFLIPWADFMKGHGGLVALKYYPYFGDSTTDYFLSYLNLLALFTYLPLETYQVIKILSICIDYVLAFGVGLLTFELTKNKAASFFSMVFIMLMPIGILNSSIWGQCDALWTCFIIYAAYYLLKKRNLLAIFIYGIGLATKLQAIFFFPVFVWLWLAKKVKLRELLMIFLGIFITLIPALLFGAKINTLFDAVIRQLGEYPNATYGAGSMYAFFPFEVFNPYMNNGGASILYALSLVGIVMVIFFYVKKGLPFTKNNFLYMMTLFSILTPFVLPHMHERYFYFADVMMFIYAINFKRRRYLPILKQLSSLICCTQILTGQYIFQTFGSDSTVFASVINLIILILLAYDAKYLEYEDVSSLKDEIQNLE